VRRSDLLLRHNLLYNFAQSRRYRISAYKPNRGEGRGGVIDGPMDFAQVSQVDMFPVGAPAEVECPSASTIWGVL
jgi:hypothetical protein